MRITALLAGVILAAALPWVAQAADSPATQPAPQPSTQPAQFTKAQIESLTAPIALFPDTLVTQILYAAAHPEDIPQALKWIQDHPTATDAEVDQQPWHPSIKALLRVPTVLKTMNDSPAWTQDLGSAFTNQHKDVMASIIQQRAAALAAVTAPPPPSVSPAQQQPQAAAPPAPTAQTYAAPQAPAITQTTPVYQPTFVATPYAYPFDYSYSAGPSIIVVGGGGGYGPPTIIQNGVVGGAISPTNSGSPNRSNGNSRVTSTSQSSFGYNPAVANSRRGNASPFVIAPPAPATNGQNNVGTQAGLSGSLATTPSGHRGR